MIRQEQTGRNPSYSRMGHEPRGLKPRRLVAGLHLNSVPARILLWFHSTLHPSPRTLGCMTISPSFLTEERPYLRERSVIAICTLFYPGSGNIPVPLLPNRLPFAG